MDQEIIDKIRDKVGKKLGGTKYANSKKKPKKETLVKVEKAIDEDRKLKAKIRNLQKEEQRINKSDDNSKKAQEEQKYVSNKIKKLMKIKTNIDTKYKK